MTRKTVVVRIDKSKGKHDIQEVNNNNLSQRFLG